MSEEWKKTTDELIALQARWKEIGAVSRRYSDQVWKRFRAACDKFFERKAAHFGRGRPVRAEPRPQAGASGRNGRSRRQGGRFRDDQGVPAPLSEIGFVPIKRKRRDTEALQGVRSIRFFSVLRGSERDRSMSRFREKVSGLQGVGRPPDPHRTRPSLQSGEAVESDIALLENNIGFFAHSKGAEALIADVREKIERAKREMAGHDREGEAHRREAARESEDREA